MVNGTSTVWPQGPWDAARPFYYTERSQLTRFMSDEYLSLFVPVAAYWILSLIFHFMDTCDWPILDRFRIHESSEIKSRNQVTQLEVVRAVLLQQVVQTLLGAFWMSSAPPLHNHSAVVQALRMHGTTFLSRLLGESALSFKSWIPACAWYTYWWIFPSVQLLFAMFFIDSWQYFLHRFFHTNRYLYKHIHSVHHRLYVPYAFGALYNHPMEGFLLDTVGAAVAHSVSMMTTRQAIVLFAISTLKTVDDHCGYRLPLDPLQFFFGNNADYHDIHHQVAGIKHNFSQPFFVHWDVICGTRMTRSELEKRKSKTKEKVA